MSNEQRMELKITQEQWQILDDTNSVFQRVKLDSYRRSFDNGTPSDHSLILKILDEPKTKTRTTYEKVDFEYAWQALKMHTEEGLYTTGYEDDEYVELINPADVVGCYEFGSLYREVEKKIDWREEVQSHLNSDRVPGDKETRWINVNFGEGYALSDSEFLEMCRTALRATGELPE